MPINTDIVSEIHTNVCDLGFDYLLKFINDNQFRKSSTHFIKAFVQNYSYECFDPDFRLFNFYFNKVSDFVNHVNEINNFIDVKLN